MYYSEIIKIFFYSSILFFSISCVGSKSKSPSKKTIPIEEPQHSLENLSDHEKEFNSRVSHSKSSNEKVFDQSSFDAKIYEIKKVTFYLTFADAQAKVNPLNISEEVDEGAIFSTPPPLSTTNGRAGLVTNPSAINYNVDAKFSHWNNMDANSTWSFGDPVKEHLNFYATWEETFRVSFYDKENGSEIYFIPVKYGQKITDVEPDIKINLSNMLLNSKRNFYIFDSGSSKVNLSEPNASLYALFPSSGQWKEQGTNNSWDFNNTVQGNLDLYASGWQKTLKVSFYDKENGSEIYFIPIISGQKITDVESSILTNLRSKLNNKKNSYIFDSGPSKVDSGEPNASLYAFFPSFGQWKEGNTNNSWDFNNTVQGNLDLYASGWQKTFKVTFYDKRIVTKNTSDHLNIDYGKNITPSLLASLGVVSGEEISSNHIPSVSLTNEEAGFLGLPPVQEIQNARFDGWYTANNQPFVIQSNNSRSPVSTVTKNLELHAKWSPMIKVDYPSSYQSAFPKDTHDASIYPTNPTPLVNAALPSISPSASNAHYNAYFYGWEKPLSSCTSGDCRYFFHEQSSSGAYSGPLYGKWTATTEQPLNKSQLIQHLFIQKTPSDKIDVSKINTMVALFISPSSTPYTGIFNQEIGGWDVREVTNMESMFSGSTMNNQYIGGWNVGKVDNMVTMFHNCSNFNPDMSRWSWKPSCNMETIRQQTQPYTNVFHMFIGTNLYSRHYDSPKTPYFYRKIQKPRNFTEPFSNFCTPSVSPVP